MLITVKIVTTSGRELEYKLPNSTHYSLERDKIVSYRIDKLGRLRPTILKTMTSSEEWAIIEVKTNIDG